MVVELDEFGSRVLSALVDGYRARDGMKAKWRSLSEYEIARRLGVVQYSYAAFDTTSERIQLRQALDQLVRQGLATRSGTSGRYDTFAPAEGLEEVNGPGPGAAPPQDASASAQLERLSRQLDEMLIVLRSIDRKLGPE